MSRRFLIAFACTFVVAGAIVISHAPLFAQNSVSRQTVVMSPEGKVISQSASEPVIVQTPDLALRVENMDHGKVTGTLVAKIDGKWVPVQLSSFNSLAR